jgi:hypothetical protein
MSQRVTRMSGDRKNMERQINDSFESCGDGVDLYDEDVEEEEEKETRERGGIRPPEKKLKSKRQKSLNSPQAKH